MIPCCIPICSIQPTRRTVSRRRTAPLQSEAERNAAESADITGAWPRLAQTMSNKAGLLKLYDEIDLPLVPVLGAHGSKRG